MELLEPDVAADTKTYNGGELPGITVEAADLSKPQRFPYGGINVVSRSINGGLDRKQRAYVNPFEGHDLVAKRLGGGNIPFNKNTKRGIHLSELKEKQFDKLPPNPTQEQYISYYNLPKDFFRRSQEEKRQLWETLVKPNITK